MTDDLTSRMANIERQLRALKAERPASVSQVASLVRQYDFSTVISAGGDTSFQLEVTASDPPFVIAIASSISTDMIDMPTGLYPWTLVGNTATATITAFNTEASTKTVDTTINLWSLNGLSATCERI